MPNLSQPIVDVPSALAYKNAIESHTPADTNFAPLMTLYLTKDLSVSTLKQAKNSGFIHAIKLYPSGVTTNSTHGIKNIASLYPLFETLSELNMPLCVHGESPDPDIDIFDRETHFIDHYLQDIVSTFPKLRVILEHISTRQAAEFVAKAPDNVAATITIHHLLFNRNHLLSGGIKPHYYCLPILKRSKDQQVLTEMALSGHPKFFLGTDSAPHAINDKQSACGCAGIFSAPVAVPLYAQFFERHQALDKLENFASRFGAQFYDLPFNEEKITLVKQTWQVPSSIPFGSQQVIPLMAGEQIDWRIEKTSL